jgi:predicted MPP superfamily phosphohydrolase
MTSFTLTSLAGYLLVVVVAGAARGRLYATFAAVILGIHTVISVGIQRVFAIAPPVFLYLQIAVYVHFLSLVWPRLRPWVYRALVSVPASWFVAGTFLSLPWALARAFGFHLPVPWLPYIVAFAGAIDSLLTRREVVDLVLDGTRMPSLGRAARGNSRTARPLRIVQITDPHLGPFMSVERLRSIAERAVERNPDLILLTGDFLTMESQGTSEALARAFAPLRECPGKVFACRGNHDLEAPEVVARALEACGVRLLIDEVVQVETEAGPVEIVGIDFRFQDRARHVADVLESVPRDPELLRVALLHDPGAFRHVPDGAADLVLSGHTHGGQIGLLWLGLPGTIVSALTSLPDHGFWGLGENRLYVHRGTGHYGFPLRVGVPAEESLIQVHRVLD